MREQEPEESGVVTQSSPPGTCKLLGEDVSYWPLLYWIGLGSSDSPTPSKPSPVRKHKWFIFALASSYCVPSCGSDPQQHQAPKAWSWEVGERDRLCEGRQAGRRCLATGRIVLCGPGTLKGVSWMAPWSFESNLGAHPFYSHLPLSLRGLVENFSFFFVRMFLVFFFYFLWVF